MKISDLTIENFKRIDHLAVSLRDRDLGTPSDRYLILGDNGSGKTTILQAIALVLGLACGKTRRIEDFDWVGFLPERYQSSGTTRISLHVTFEESEIELTRELATAWYGAQSPDFRARSPFILPGNSREVVLTLQGSSLTAAPNGLASLFQLRGRHYLLNGVREPNWRMRMLQLPGVFWFDQYRNLGASPSARNEDRDGTVSYDVGVDRLREYLVGWATSRQGRRQGEPDFLGEVDQRFGTIFPGRAFSRVAPAGDVIAPLPRDFHVLFKELGGDREREYDLVEMSGGEQAVFPLLYEIVRQRVGNSIVLIDELDLNLHAPAAQALLGALPRLAPSCQWIATTHSTSVSSLVGDSEIYRVPGGNLCL